MNRRSPLPFALGAVLGVAGMTAGCSELKMGNLTLSQAFDDPNVIALVEAACKGDATEVRRLIDAGANVNFKGRDDARPLPWAMQCENVDGLNALLDAGADPNYLYQDRLSAIWLAAGSHDVGVLKALIAHGADLNRWEGADETPLMRAMDRGIELGDWKNYYALMEAGADIGATQETGYSLMEYAIALGQFDKATELLERGYRRDLPKVYSLALSSHVSTKMQAYKDKQVFLRELDRLGVKPDYVDERSQR